MVEVRIGSDAMVVAGAADVPAGSVDGAALDDGATLDAGIVVATSEPAAEPLVTPPSVSLHAPAVRANASAMPLTGDLGRRARVPHRPIEREPYPKSEGAPSRLRHCPGACARGALLGGGAPVVQ